MSCDRRREQRRQKYGIDADANTTVPDNVEQLDDVDAASTPASQRLIDHDDDQPDHIRTSLSGRQHARASERPRDAAAAAAWSDHLLPPPPPRPSRCLLPATSRREFMETSF